MTAAALTVQELTKALQISPQSVYRLVKRGLLPRLPGLRCIRVPREGLDGYLAAQKGLAVSIPGGRGSVCQGGVSDPQRGPQRPGSAQKRSKGGEALDPNRHGLTGGHE